MGRSTLGLGYAVAMSDLVYRIHPPTQKSSPEAPVWAAKELAVLGPMSRGEMTMAVLALRALLFRIFGGELVNATTVALVVGLMIPFKVVTWDDLLGNKPAWNILFWYGTLMIVFLALGIPTMSMLFN